MVFTGNYNKIIIRKQIKIILIIVDKEKSLDSLIK